MIKCTKHYKFDDGKQMIDKINIDIISYTNETQSINNK